MEAILKPFITDLKETVEKAPALLQSFFIGTEDRRNITWKAGFSLYNDCCSIASTQLRTLQVASELAGLDHYREALILCRSVYEYYCYFRLMCEADRFTLLFTPNESESLSNFTSRLEADLVHRKSSGETHLLHTTQQRRLRGKHVGVVLESSVRATHHYWSVFNIFDPIECFLDLEEYANYYEYSNNPELREQIRMRDKQSKEDHHIRYKAWLTQEAIQEHLLENTLITPSQLQVAKSHYAFLSSFAHPSASGLEKLNREDTYLREILIQNYCAYMATGFCYSVLRLIERDREYVTSFIDPGIRALRDDLHRRHSYFWFITNGPCEYDFFDNWTKTHRRSELPRELPIEDIKPSHNPFFRLKDVFQGKATWRIREGKKVGRIFYHAPTRPEIPAKIRASSVDPERINQKRLIRSYRIRN